ncbi:SDH family Clp fold serine proteinase [Bradyrhizobium ivorense]|nr:hypothetical protein [Bradyrhizobium ivorense]
MFTAMNAARYQRQTLIKDIETEHPKLLCYVAGNKAQVDRIDTLGFVDMLHNVNPGDPIDLLLHTPGGDVDAAEKLIGLVRSATGEEGQLRVIIPDFAKSAGTLMALGANAIVMSDSSELGPIDPQVSSRDGNGSDVVYSVLTYLNAYDAARCARGSRRAYHIRKVRSHHRAQVPVGQRPGALVRGEFAQAARQEFLEDRQRADGY